MERSADEFARSATVFPLVGLAIGLVLVLFDWLLHRVLSSALLSALLVTMLVLASRGFHMDGLADTFDGLGAGGDRERILAVMDDSHIGAFGVVAIVLVVLIKIEAIDSIGDSRWRALLLAPILSRWAMVLFAYRSKPAKEGLGSTMIANMDSIHFFGATCIALVLAAVIQRTIGVALIAWVALFTLTWKAYFHHRLGGVTGDTFGAVAELNETSVLVLLALG